ncbi:hypothetical protein HS088_TW07G00287 [Tripterygium wilfordii]|uniref:Transmembrane protein n=1 Tax=Tripterygium wilfordii TaxID=458696 RepID=A0A7J7DEL3_TRIWF|nr:uncharacterized protein LOC120003035 [Tripterygium wilfordii]KAF5744708.1 hypothetical protein HS088_TW07G00287 [Tripterygium wilfordii]
MSPMTSFIFLFSSLAFLITARAQGRAPHGLANANPMAFSPSAVEFFHPNTKEPDTKSPCEGSSCSPLHLAAQVRSTPAYESKFSTSSKSGNRLGAGAMAGIVFSVASVVLLAMGAFYVFRSRQTNVSRANSVQASNSVKPDA